MYKLENQQKIKNLEKLKRLSIPMIKERHDLIKFMAVKEGFTMEQLINKIIEEYARTHHNQLLNDMKMVIEDKERLKRLKSGKNK